MKVPHNENSGYCKCDECRDVLDLNKHFRPTPGNPLLESLEFKPNPVLEKLKMKDKTEPTLEDIKNRMKDELFQGQAWYAVISKADIIWLVNEIEELQVDLIKTMNALMDTPKAALAIELFKKANR
jgi:hypothetical protein